MKVYIGDKTLLICIVGKGRLGYPCLPGGACADYNAVCQHGICICRETFYEKYHKCGKFKLPDRCQKFHNIYYLCTIHMLWSNYMIYFLAPRGLFDSLCLPRTSLPCIEPHNMCEEGVCVCDEDSFVKHRRCSEI